MVKSTTTARYVVKRGSTGVSRLERTRSNPDKYCEALMRWCLDGESRRRPVEAMVRMVEFMGG